MSPHTVRATLRAPRLSAGADVVRADDRAVIAAGSRRMVLKGAAAAAVASRLLPLLDGTRDAGELAAQSGIERRHVESVLRLLDERRLLETGGDPVQEDAVAAETAAFYARHSHTLGAHDGAAPLLRTLRRGRALLVGRSELTEPLAAILEESGVRTGVHSGGLMPDEPYGDTALVVGVKAGSSSSMDTARRIGADLSVPVLRVGLFPGRVEIGPYIAADAPNCGRCLARGRSEAGWAPSGPPDLDEGTVDLVCGFAANETVAFLARSAVMLGRYEMRRIDLTSWTGETYLATPYLDCPRCRAEPREHASRADAAVDAYELACAAPPPSLAAADAAPAGRTERFRELQTVRDRLGTHPRVGLDRFAGPRYRRAERRGSRPGLGELGSLLNRTVGFRRFDDSGEPSRWAPSGGNLGSVEAYVLLRGGVPGLPGNLFKYMDLTHELLAVAPEPVGLDGALALDPAGPVPSCLVFLVSDHQRIAEKYGDFAMRLARLDAGCASLQLRLVAHSLGLAVEYAKGWSPRLGEAIRLEGPGRSVAAAAAVRPREETRHADARP
ncbi:MAG TPA: hypothetical protein VFU12_07180 [Glycomyces sp.]|nr:hypothetical protein [Glycomyces sp.]